MIRYGILVTVWLFITSCSVVAPVDEYLRDQKVGDQTEMFNLVINRWGKQKFSGLLIIQSSRKGIHYILLDPTGIKLLESKVYIEKQNVSETPRGPLAGTTINKFLTRTIKRIWLETPGKLPCMWNGLTQFCYTVYPEGNWEKKYKLGPLSIWSAEKRIKATITQYEYVFTQPWIGMGAELRRLNRTK